MSKCININHPEFKELVKQTNLDPLRLSTKMGLWMEKNNTDAWPTLEQLGIYSNKSLTYRLTSFLNNLNVTTEFRDELKEKSGYEAYSMTDLLYKTILIRNDFKRDGLLKETAYVAYSMLGKKNKIRTDLIHSVENLPNYKSIYGFYKNNSPQLNEYKLKELILVDFIADAIHNNFKAPKDSYVNAKADYWKIEGDTAFERRVNYILAKIQQFLENLFTNTKLSEDQLVELVDDLAHDVLKANFQKFGSELTAEQQLTNYEDTIASDKFAHSIVTEFQRMGLLFTGSLSLRKEGTIYRDAKENLHDLDFSLEYDKHGEFFNDIIKKLEKEPGAATEAGREYVMNSLVHELNRNYKKHPILNQIKTKFPTYKITKSFAGTRSGEVVVTGTIEGKYVIDIFFVHDTELASNEPTFQDWEPIFKAKLRMGRSKDIRDFANYVPFSMKVGQAFGQEPGFRHFVFNRIKNDLVYEDEIPTAKETLSEPAYAKLEMASLVNKSNPKTYVNKLAKAQEEYPGEIDESNNPAVWDQQNKHKTIEWSTDKNGVKTKTNKVFTYNKGLDIIKQVKEVYKGFQTKVLGVDINKAHVTIDIKLPLSSYAALDAHLGLKEDEATDTTVQPINPPKSPLIGPDGQGTLELGRVRKPLFEEITSDEGKDEANAKFTAGAAKLSKSERVYKKILDALGYRLQVIQRSEKRLQEDMQVELIESIIAENDTIERMVNVVSQADKVMSKIAAERQALLDENKQASPYQLYRWKEIVSAWDALDEYLTYMSVYDKGEAAKYTPELIRTLQDVITVKNGIKELYRIDGIEMMINFLTPYYNRVYAATIFNERKSYKKKVRAYMKANNVTREVAIEKEPDIQGMSEQEWVDDYIVKNAEALKEETRQSMRVELEKASKDINSLYRWMDNVLDSRDPVVAAMVKAFADTHNMSRLQADHQSHKLLKVVEEFESLMGNTSFANLKELYDFMLEKDSEGNPTGHYISRFRSSALNDYRSFLSEANEIFTPEEMGILKRVWKNGEISLFENQHKKYYAMTKGHNMDDDLASTKPIKERIDFFKKYKGIETNQVTDAEGTVYYEFGNNPDAQLNFKGNVPLDKVAFSAGLNRLYKKMFDSGDLTQEEFYELELNQKRSENERLSFSRLEQLGAIRESTASMISEWMFDNTWKLFRTPAPKYLNDQWDKLVRIANSGNDVSNLSEDEKAELIAYSTDPRIKLFSLVMKMGEEADQLIPYKFRLGTRLPGVVMDNLERVVNDKQNLFTVFKRNIVQGFTLRAEDLERGGRDNEIIDLNKNPKYFLPIHYTSDVAAEDRSYDIPTLYMKYWAMANDHANKSKILPYMEMAKYFVQTRDVVKPSYDKEGNLVEQKMAQNHLYEQINDWMKMVVYGKSKIEGKSFNIFGLNINLEKTLDVINSYTTHNLLALNVIGGTSNVVLAQALQTIEAFAKQYISPKSYAKGGLVYWKNYPGILADIKERRPKNVVSLLLHHWDVLNDYSTPEYRKNNLFSQLMNSNTMFFTSHAGEHMVQGQMFLSFLEEKRAYDNDGKDIGSMLDMYSAKDRELVLDPRVDLEKSQWTDGSKIDGKVTRNYQEEFRVKMGGILSKLHGEYSDLGVVAIQQYALGRMAYTFRKFAIPGFKRRWEAFDYSERLGEFTEGAYISFGKFIGDIHKDLIALKFDIMSEKWEDLSDMEKANIHRTIGEIISLITSMILLALITNLKGESDDDNKKLRAFLMYQMYRFQSEILFYVSPPSALAILRSPMASLSVLENLIQVMSQMRHPFEDYERGNNKGRNKLFKEISDMVPYTRQWYRVNHLQDSISWFKN